MRDRIIIITLLLVLACMMAACSMGGGSEDIYVDSASGLMWQANDMGKKYNGFEATGTKNSFFNKEIINVCGDLKYAEHEDWRLPNIKELTSIVDKNNMPMIKTGFTVKAMNFWSSSKVSGDFGWVLLGQEGRSFDQAWSSENGVLCVRRS